MAFLRNLYTLYMQQQGSSSPWFSHLQYEEFKIWHLVTLKSPHYKSFPAGGGGGGGWLKENLCVVTSPRPRASEWKSLPRKHILYVDRMSVRKTLIGIDLFIIRGLILVASRRLCPTCCYVHSHLRQRACSSLPLRREPGMKTCHPSAQLPNPKHIQRAGLGRCLSESF